MKITIHLDSEVAQAEVIVTESDGARTEKKLSFPALQEVFQLVADKEYYERAPLFKELNTDEVPGLLIGRESEEVTEGVFFIPAENRYMNFVGEEFILPYPSLLFYLRSVRGVLDKSLCFSLKEKTLEKVKKESVLYAFPYGNVNSSGSICWGSNRMVDLKGFAGLSVAIETFFSSESNMDYVRAGTSYADKKLGYAEFLREVCKKTTFPLSQLVPSTIKGTVVDILLLVNENLRK